MEQAYTKMMLVSANVGSIFEEPEKMLSIWLEEFLSTVSRLQPQFLAIHCQEVGGKNYEESMQHVNSFVKALFSAESMQMYDRSRFFLDEDFTAVDQFTALGNIYFVHNSVDDIQIYDFQECQYVPLEGREVLSGNISAVPIKEKAKFPQEYFPDFKWSRKGFIRTRWSIHGSVLDLVNIHLFHDASNITAMGSSPSQYSESRERTLRYTLNRFETDQFAKVPQFIFGDFNFRLDSLRLVQKLTEGSTAEKIRGKKNDVSKIVYTSKTTNEVILTVEKKGFDHHQSKEIFLNNNGHGQLHEFDCEMRPFRDRLLECDITFPPSYPFSEDVSEETCYNKTRCPAWCDRILYTPDTKPLFYDDVSDYAMIGVNTCMGDHKPIYLTFRLRNGVNLASPGIAALPDSSSMSSSPLSVVSCPSVPPTPTHAPPPPQASASPIDSPTSDAAKQPRKHRRLEKVISINGEEVSADDMTNVNIHDYASFKYSEHIGRKFMDSIKRKEGADAIRRSFRNVVKDVIRREKIMRALRHYSHRSDSEETEDTEAEEASMDERLLCVPERHQAEGDASSLSSYEDRASSPRPSVDNNANSDKSAKITPLPNATTDQQASTGDEGSVRSGLITAKLEQESLSTDTSEQVNSESTDHYSSAKFTSSIDANNYPASAVVVSSNNNLIPADSLSQSCDAALCDSTNQMSHSNKHKTQALATSCDLPRDSNRKKRGLRKCVVM